MTFSYSRGKPSHRLALWLDLLVLTLSDPTVAWHAVGLSRSDKKLTPLVHDLQVAGADAAERHAAAEQALEVVVELHQAGHARAPPALRSHLRAVASRPEAPGGRHLAGRHVPRVGR